MTQFRVHERIHPMEMVCVGAPAHGRCLTVDSRQYTMQVPLRIGELEGDLISGFPSSFEPTREQNVAWHNNYTASRVFVFEYRVESFYYAGCSMTLSGFALRYHELSKHAFPKLALSLIMGGLLMPEITP